MTRAGGPIYPVKLLVVPELVSPYVGEHYMSYWGKKKLCIAFRNIEDVTV